MNKVTAKNLMIGDWVKSNSKFRKVLGLATTRMKLSTDNKYECLIAKSATPILITEEWLKLNGWIQSPLTTQIMYGKSISKDLTMFYSVSNKSLMVSLFEKNTANYKKHVNFIGCIYIHQLQQAYRLATGGKELKLKF